MIEIFAKKLRATGDSSMPQGYRYEDDSTLHIEIIQSAGKVATEKYYKTWDAGTEALSDLAVEVTYTYAAQKLTSKVVKFYFEDNTVGLTLTTDFKSDDADPNRQVIIRTKA